MSGGVLHFPYNKYPDSYWVLSVFYIVFDNDPITDSFLLEVGSNEFTYIGRLIFKQHFLNKLQFSSASAKGIVPTS